jgi:beta-glucosidase
VHEYLRTLFAYGFFDRAAYVNDPTKVDQANSTAVDVATEERGATLLKNDRVLPLTGTHEKIAVIGAPAQDYVFGFGSSQVQPNHTVTLLQGIRARATQAGDTVTYDDGSNVSLAETDAKAANVAIVVAGDSEAEGVDKQCMSLTPQCAPTQISDLSNQNPQDEQAAWGDQDQLISDIAGANKHTVVVLETGAPVLTPWRSQIAGLLEAWYPGEDGGTAVAHVLWGDVDAAGRLPVTFPADYSQEPTATSPDSYPGVPDPALDTGAPGFVYYRETFTEGVFPGYRWFDAHHLAPAYPFGFGLSYTSFRYSKLSVGAGPAAGGYVARVTVTNTGSRTGDAVPELYVSLPSRPGVPEPPWQLKGFDKVELAPGQSERVSMPLDPRSFSYWSDSANAWEIARGCDAIGVGPSSARLPLRAVIGEGGATCGPGR